MISQRSVGPGASNAVPQQYTSPAAVRPHACWTMLSSEADPLLVVAWPPPTYTKRSGELAAPTTYTSAVSACPLASEPTICTWPVAFAVTIPVGSTVAILALDVFQRSAGVATMSTPL